MVASVKVRVPKPDLVSVPVLAAKLMAKVTFCPLVSNAKACVALVLKRAE